MNTVGGAPLQLKYIGNTLVETNRYSQVEALYMGNGNPASALIFGHSNLGGNPNSPQEIASSAVVWNADGNIIRTVGPALPGFAACDMENGECPWTEARDGTSYQTVVGVNFLPRDLYPNHACALPHVAPSGFPREAFIYTPSAGIQKLRDYAYTGFGSSPAGLAARAELAKWNLCDAEAVYESGSVITIAGIGVRSPDGNPANRTTQGYVIHILKPAKANLTAGSTTNVNTFYVNSIDH